jgi:hypothetical protein
MKKGLSLTRVLGVQTMYGFIFVLYLQSTAFEAHRRNSHWATQNNPLTIKISKTPQSTLEFSSFSQWDTTRKGGTVRTSSGGELERKDMCIWEGPRTFKGWGRKVKDKQPLRLLPCGVSGTLCSDCYLLPLWDESRPGSPPFVSASHLESAVHTGEDNSMSLTAWCPHCRPAMLGNIIA